MKEKIGLVLEGGGAKGAYHLGVYKALMEMGYHFSGIAGTSIGALNGALIAQGSWKESYYLWYNSSNHAAYGIDDVAITESARYAATVIGDAIKGRGLDVESMKDLFSEIFDEKKLRKSKVELGIVTVKMPEFKTVELFKDQIPKGDLFEYLLASANFPLFQTNITLEDKFVDGGFKNNLPLDMLPKRGIDKLIAVRTLAPGFTKNFHKLDIDVTYIEPSKNIGSIMDFRRDRARANLTLGYFDAYKTLKGYVGKEFCIIPLTEDFTYLNRLMNTADDKIIKAAQVMGYSHVNPQRFMFERLLPQIADYLDIGLNTSYEIVILTFFEEIAMTLDIDRNIIYKADDFITLVQRAFFEEHQTFNRYKKLPRIVQSSTFLSSFVKSDFFHFIMDIFFK